VTLLDIRDLHTEIRLKRSTVHALGGISLTVDTGETLGLVGESGCGKTMTANSVMRLLPNGGHITEGEVLLDGRNLVDLPDSEMAKVRGNEIGMIFQDPMSSLNPTMTIGDQVAETVILHRGASKKDARNRAVDTLRLVGMPSPEQRAKDYPHQLSGGM
jgi:peptide/nickel transport system ATP-binding protein